MARHEWTEQVRLSALLDRWLPDGAFPTAMDTVASALAGAMRKKRGVKPGIPDNWVLYRGKLITIELKSPQGRTQREVREKLLKAGAQWFDRSRRACASENLVTSAMPRSANYVLHTVTATIGFDSQWGARDRRLRRAVSEDRQRGRHGGGLAET